MKLSGIQKLTLLDFPGKVACTLFTPGCNFRCPFCHNASLVFSCVQNITEQEVLSFLDKRRGILDGVCITGGEPLLQKDIAVLLREIKARGFLLKLDSNGAFPERLAPLLEAGLVDYVAMDIKASRRNYHTAIGLATVDLDSIERSVQLLKESGVDHEFRTTTVKGIHTAKDFADIAQWLAGEEKYFIQQYTPSDDMIGEAFEQFTKEELEAFADIVRATVKTVELRGI
ncbi:MAG: anaerobic ribonucleoside-triphosphate reductase activating protein [Clostridia bacterium]|nr:anaerobic ribonucleoside-triphosphate reductase activating protein [Clostridia bacterium]